MNFAPLVLAAATGAQLPFMPPAEWTQLPSGATAAQVKNVWQQTLPNGKHANFTEVVMPLPIGAAAASQGMRSAMKRAGANVSSQSITLCGVQGQLITVQETAGGQAMTMMHEIVGKGGYTYMLMYTRAQGSAADPAILRIMRAFCPSGTSRIPQLAVPPNWKPIAGSGLQSMGVWLGTQPMQMMVLMKGSHMASLEALLNETRAENHEVNNKYLHIVATQNTTLCGLPARFVSLEMKAPAMSMDMQQVVTQGTGASYALTYAYPASEKPDPAAIVALHTLCATGRANLLPSPQPAATATPVASPAPAVTAAPASTPVPSASPPR